MKNIDHTQFVLFLETNDVSVKLFIDLISVLNKTRLRWCMFGSCALKCYAPMANTTKDVDFLFNYNDRTKIISIIKQEATLRSWDVWEFTMGYRINVENSDIYMELCFASDDPYESAVRDANKLKVFGHRIPIIKPEYAIWSYLITYLDNMTRPSGRPEDDIDIQEILNKRQSEILLLLKK
jgi:hypothetical protein